MNRNAQTVSLIEIAESLEDELYAGNINAAQRIARQLVNGLSIYAREQQIVQAIERNGLTAPSVIRSLAEYKRERLAVDTDEPPDNGIEPHVTRGDYTSERNR